MHQWDTPLLTLDRGRHHGGTLSGFPDGGIWMMSECGGLDRPSLLGLPACEGFLESQLPVPVNPGTLNLCQARHRFRRGTFTFTPRDDRSGGGGGGGGAGWRGDWLKGCRDRVVQRGVGSGGIWPRLPRVDTEWRVERRQHLRVLDLLLTLLQTTPDIHHTNSPYKTYGDYCMSVDISPAAAAAVRVGLAAAAVPVRPSPPADASVHPIIIPICLPYKTHQQMIVGGYIVTHRRC